MNGIDEQKLSHIGVLFESGRLENGWLTSFPVTVATQRLAGFDLAIAHYEVNELLGSQLGQ